MLSDTETRIRTRFCSAICYADLKREADRRRIYRSPRRPCQRRDPIRPRALSASSRRSYIASFEPRLSDVQYRKVAAHRPGNVAAPRVGLHERKRHPDARGRR
ncbi:MAG: hypothetical protein ACLR4Z_04450 [Butyricicoccaceae bacterium]